MGNLGLTVISGCLTVALLWWPGISDAATYQLQVASLPERIFMYFVRGRTLPRAEAFLDDTGRSRYVFNSRPTASVAGANVIGPVGVAACCRYPF